MSKSSKKRRKARRRGRDRHLNSQSITQSGNHHHQHNHISDKKRKKIAKRTHEIALDLITTLRLTIILNPGRPLYELIGALSNDPNVRMLLPTLWSQRWDDMSLMEFWASVAHGKVPPEVKPKGLDPWKSLLYMVEESKAVAGAP